MVGVEVFETSYTLLGLAVYKTATLKPTELHADLFFSFLPFIFLTSEIIRNRVAIRAKKR